MPTVRASTRAAARPDPAWVVRWLVALLAVALLSVVPRLRAAEWTLGQALAQARENSPDARVAQARVAGAEAMLEQAGSAWMPQLQLSGRYTQTNNAMMAFGSILNQRAFSFGLDFNHPGQIDDLNLTGTVAYNLYSGGQATAGRNAARAGAAASAHDLQAARLQLDLEVVRAYFNLRKAREAVSALAAGLRAYEAAVANARLRFEAGQLLKADLLSLEVQLAQTRELHASARHGAELAGQAFRFVLGLPAAVEPVELAAADPGPALIAAPSSGDYTRRPELRGLEERARAAAAMVEAARGGRRPVVNAFASYQYDQGWKLDRDADGWMAGLSVELNVFDGGRTSGRIRQAGAELDQVNEMIRRATLGIALEAEQARLAHADACERLSVSARAVELAEESAALSRARFEKGALLAAELIGVESRLVEARMRRLVAEADERIALAALRHAFGLPPLADS